MTTATNKKTVRDDYLELIQRFPLTPIRNQRQLKDAHAMIDELTRIPENKLTDGQGDYLEVLGDLALKFEQPVMAGEVNDVTSIDLLRHLLDDNDINASDLGRILGHRELGSKILRGERQISRANAQALGEHFGLPAETFLR